jgi:hypothetical protein
MTEHFEAIYTDGTCTLCPAHGIVLAQDVFAPGVALWLCGEHWTEYQQMLSIVTRRDPNITPSRLDYTPLLILAICVLFCVALLLACFLIVIPAQG